MKRIIIIFIAFLTLTSCVVSRQGCNKKVSPQDVWYNKGGYRSQKAYR